MSRLRIFGSVLLGTVLTMSACAGSCSQAPQLTTPTRPPTVLALVLEIQESGVRLVKAVPSQGAVTTPSIAARSGAIRRGDCYWIEYVLRGGSDRPMQAGALAVSMNTIVERTNLGPGGLVRAPKRTVTVAVPYAPQATSIAFARAIWSDAPPEQWQRVPLGTSPLTIGAIR